MILVSTLILMSPVIVVVSWMLISWLKEHQEKIDNEKAKFTVKALSEGNIGFSYAPKLPSERKLTNMIALVFLLLAVTMFVISWLKSIWSIAIVIIPIAIFAYIYKDSNVVSTNRKRERNGILPYYSQDKISELCQSKYGEDIRCLYREYVIRHTDRPGVFQRMILAGLSNGAVVMFRVVQRKNEKGMWSLTIRTVPEEIDSELMAFSALPLHVWAKRYFNPDSNVLVAFLLYLLIWAILVAAFTVPAHFSPTGTLIAVAVYVVTSILLYVFVGVGRMPKWLVVSLEIPGRLFDLLIKLTAPILVFLAATVVIFLVGMLIAAILYGVSWMVTGSSIGFNVNYAVFLLIVSLSLSSVYANSLIFHIFEHMDIFWNMTEKSMESPMIRFVEYVYKKENINCLIYISYLAFIIISTAKYYLNGSEAYLVNKDIDHAVTAAFLVHIAFTNMMTRWKELKISLEGVMKYMVDIMSMK